MRIVHWINLALLVLLFGGSALVWPRLPDRIPGHFGLGGNVTRWTEASLTGWFMMPLVALALAALNYWIALMLYGRPHLFNLPDRDVLLGLPTERQRPVVRKMQDSLYGISGMVLALFTFVQWTTYRTAMGFDSRPYMIVVLITSVLMGPIILALWIPRIQNEIRRQAKLHREGP